MKGALAERIKSKYLWKHQNSLLSHDGPKTTLRLTLVILILAGLGYSLYSFGDTIRLPGEDITSKMTGVGTLVKFAETGLFKILGRLLAGICIFACGWSVKESKIGVALLCFVAAFLFGTAQMWVKNIFSIGDGESIFSQVNFPSKYAKQSQKDVPYA